MARAAGRPNVTPPAGEQEAVRRRFAAAVDALVEAIKPDRSVLAAVLCGSLSHDMVWAKSDVDLVLVTVDDRKIEQGELSLYADGVNVHAILFPRAVFRKLVEGSLRNSFIHSFMAKGRLLYTHDPTIAGLCATLPGAGARDSRIQLLRAGTAVLHPMYKARKWFISRGDLDYTALWILYAATPAAQIEVIRGGLLVDREVIPQALRLNPGLFRTIYSDLLNAGKTRARVEAALETLESFMAERASQLFAPIVEHLRDVREARSCRDLADHFRRNFEVDDVTTACEYLADRGLLGKASVATRLTRKSNVDVQELAFFDVGPPGRP